MALSTTVQRMASGAAIHPAPTRATPSTAGTARPSGPFYPQTHDVSVGRATGYERMAQAQHVRNKSAQGQKPNQTSPPGVGSLY